MTTKRCLFFSLVQKHETQARPIAIADLGRDRAIVFKHQFDRSADGHVHLAIKFHPRATWRNIKHTTVDRCRTDP